MDPTTLINLIPSGPTRDRIITALVIIAIAGRVIHAIRTGGGIRAIWNGLLFGTNTPPEKK